MSRARALYSDVPVSVCPRVTAPGLRLSEIYRPEHSEASAGAKRYGHLERGLLPHHTSMTGVWSRHGFG